MGVRPVGSVGGNGGPLGALQHPWVLIGVGYRNPQSCLCAWAVLQHPWVLIVRPVGSQGGNGGPLGALQPPWVQIGVGYRNPRGCLGAWGALSIYGSTHGCSECVLWDLKEVIGVLWVLCSTHGCRLGSDIGSLEGGCVPGLFSSPHGCP